VVEHPLDRGQAQGLGLVVVVEDLVVDPPRLCIFDRMLVFEVTKRRVDLES
jgi:hypothetical protein